MKKKVKCSRCREITSIDTRIKNIIEAIASFEARGMPTGILEDGLLATKEERYRKGKEICSCTWAEQAVLPIGNTGVKMSAFPEGIAQRAPK